MNVRLVKPCDKLVRDGDALLLYPDELIRLSSLGSVVAELTDSPISILTLTAEMENQFGSPRDTSTTQAVQAVVDELVTRGVLEIV